MLEIKGISKQFGEHTALEAVDLTIQDGEFFSLLGPSGCGKTTLLRLLGGFDSPTTGQILLDGKPFHGSDERLVNMVFQRYALFPHLNVFENVAFGLRVKNVPEPEVKTRVAEALQLVKMQAFAQRGVDTLSGGQQQRIALARALVNRPRVLLLDEPLSALDLKLRQQMQIELVTLQRRLNITFIFVTHDQEEALRLSDRIAVMNGGQIEQVGTPFDIYEYPKTAFVADFIGTINAIQGRVQAADANEVALRLPTGELIFAHPTRDGKRPLPKVQVGDAAIHMVRPESLFIAPEPAPGHKNVIPGIIKEVLYKGHVTEILIEPSVPNVPNLLVSEPNGSPTLEQCKLDIGAKFFVTWPPDDGFIMANGAANAPA